MGEAIPAHDMTRAATLKYTHLLDDVRIHAHVPAEEGQVLQVREDGQLSKGGVSKVELVVRADEH